MAPPSAVHNGVPASRAAEPTAKLAKATPAVADGPGWAKNMIGEAELVTPRPAWWWTAAVPQDTSGYHEERQHLTALPLTDLSKVSRQQALDYFTNTWVTTEILFSALQGEEPFYRPPYHELRHPLIFYYGHPAVFYINKLRVAGLISTGINEHFESIFEVGVDEMSWDDLSKNDAEWPSVRAVNEYRRQAFALVKRAIITHPALEQLPVTQHSPAWALFMALEHEKIHIETSSVLMRELPVHLVIHPPHWPAYHPTAITAAATPPPPRANPMVTVAAADVALGKPVEWASFGWDNEYGARTLHVRQFQASKCLVSNAEFYTFVKSGGYRTLEYWSSEGWHWRTFRNAKWPTFWVPDGPEGLHQYRLRLNFDVVAMAWALPVEVNWHEAHAYCMWLAERDSMESNDGGGSGGAYRLMTEGEHHRMRSTAKNHAAEDAVMGAAHTLAAQYNINLQWASACAVDALPNSEAGFHDTFGSVWEWCEDHFAALPGFKVHPLYDDFSTPCFDGQHNLIMGGSFASTGDLASRFARFHFRPHFFQHAGFRVVRTPHSPLLSSMDAPPPYAAGWTPPSADPSKARRCATNQSAELISRQLQQHFPVVDCYANRNIYAHPSCASYLQPLERFPKRCAEVLARAAARLGISPKRALDIGCGVGGTCFELARTCQEVIGLDQSAAVIAAANSMRTQGKLELFQTDEVEQGEYIEVQVDDDIDRERVIFKQMDAMCLAPALGEFDVVVLSHVLEFLISPTACLGRLGGRQGVVRVGGLALVASSFEWNANFTPRDLWLGGRRSEGDGSSDSGNDDEPDRNGAEMGLQGESYSDKQQTSVQGLQRVMLANHFEQVLAYEMPVVTQFSVRKWEVVTLNVSVWRRVA